MQWHYGVPMPVTEWAVLEAYKTKKWSESGKNKNGLLYCELVGKFIDYSRQNLFHKDSRHNYEQTENKNYHNAKQTYLWYLQLISFSAVLFLVSISTTMLSTKPLLVI